MPLPAVSEAAASAAGDEQAGTCSQGSQARSTAALPLLQPGNVKGTAAGANDTQVTFRHLLCHNMRQQLPV